MAAMASSRNRSRGSRRSGSKDPGRAARLRPKGRTAGPGGGAWIGLALALVPVGALWLGFFVLSACFLAPVFGHGWLWLGTNTLFSLGLPAAVAMYMVRPLSGFAWAAWFVGVFAVVPLLAVLGLSFGAPDRTASALRQHAEPLFEHVLGPTTRSAPARWGADLSAAWADRLDTPQPRRSAEPEAAPRKSARPRPRRQPRRALFFQGLRRPRTRPRPAHPAHGRTTRVSFQRRGGALFVRARVTGRQSARLRLVLDTGATLSALTHEAGRKLGLQPPKRPVTVELDTAGGRRSFPLAVVRRIRVGQVSLRHVTVALCDDCSPPGLYGLLGLNFTQHFVTSIDQRKRRLSLSPHRGPRNRIDDVDPFLRLAEVEAHTEGKRFRLQGKVQNRSPRRVRSLRLRAVLLDSRERVLARHQTEIESLPAGQTKPFSLQAPGHPELTRYRIEPIYARW